MSKGKVLITGGAGFIGSHLADELLQQGYQVRALDALLPQVHGEAGARPEYLHRDVELMEGFVEDRETLRRALDGADSVVHLAARVGVGQSMYRPADYTQTNNMGTAVLMEEIVERNIGKLVVASSMSIYGEGMYANSRGEIVNGSQRALEDLRERRWELTDDDGGTLRPIPTREDKAPDLASIYALSKFDQERMCLLLGRAYNIPTVALRFFNVYGPRQALSNPYTGVLAIFASQLLHGQPPAIFEDGNQRRDFVNVKDIARACRLALENDEVTDDIFNIGSGVEVSIREVADALAAVMDKASIQPRISGKYRVGDIRHCFADISRARECLGYEPQIRFEEGLRELAGWLDGQTVENRFSQASAELQERGLTV